MLIGRQQAAEIGRYEARVTISGNLLSTNGYRSTETDTDTASRRIDDGLHTNVPIGSEVTVTRNQTFHNAGSGIEALPIGSVRDGGGNRSIGDRYGCAGVTCR